MKTLDLTLYLATDPDLIGDRDLCSVVREAVEAGVTVVQLRDKQADSRDLYDIAVRLKQITAPAGVPLIINDRVDVMLAADADGVHVGARDLPLEHVRRLAGERIVGYSVNDADDLRTAVTYGADYIGIGPIFATSTKPDARGVLGVKGMKTLLETTDLPAVGIGGIGPGNCADVVEAGARGVCAISAILGHDDVREAVSRFRNALANAAKQGA